MREKRVFVLILLLLIILALAIGYIYYSEKIQTTNPTGEVIKNPEDNPINDSMNYSIIKIASFNPQIFGDKKLKKLGVNYYTNLISEYDIFVIQEIRDENGNSFKSLCNNLPDYKCYISSRAGRSVSKEQYGIIYKKNFSVSFKDYNPDNQDRWERPPVDADFNINGFNLTIFTIHTRPEETPIEIRNLENVIPDKGNEIIIGDLNADCSYYNRTKEKDFSEWIWVITDNNDTTTGNTNCAYDRIILNKNATKEFVNYGIDKNIKLNESDHYLVWVELKI